MPRILYRVPCALLAGFVLLGPAPGQQPEIMLARLYVPLDRGLAFQMVSKKAIKNFQLSKEGVVKAEAVADNPNAIMVNGLALGDTVLTLEDAAGKKERYELVCRRELVVPLGVSIRLELVSKKPVGKADSGGFKVARVRTLPDDPLAIQLDALAPGLCLVALSDKEGKKEEIRIEVRKVHLLLEPGETKKLQLSSKAVIDTVALDVGGIVDIAQTVNADFIELKGVAVGVVRVLLTDKDKKTETFDIGVKAKKE